VHPEGAAGQAGRIDPAEPAGGEGERGDLFATVEGLRVEGEPDPGAGMAAGLSGRARQGQPGGGARAGGEYGTTADRCGHAASLFRAC